MGELRWRGCVIAIPRTLLFALHIDQFPVAKPNAPHYRARERRWETIRTMLRALRCMWLLGPPQPPNRFDEHVVKMLCDGEKPCCRYQLLTPLLSPVPTLCHPAIAHYIMA